MVINFQTWITFAIASEFILLIPGPMILLVVAYSLSHGKTATFPLVTGVGFGDFTAMVFSFTGLGLLLNQASELFTLFKWVGALYLIYLGIQLWRMPVESTDWSDDTPMSQSPSRMLWHAWITTALNPKTNVYFLAFLPQFINPESEFLIQVSVLGTTFWVLAVINALGYAWLAVGSVRSFATLFSNRV